jgi:hypothetical protein
LCSSAGFSNQKSKATKSSILHISASLLEKPDEQRILYPNSDHNLNRILLTFLKNSVLICFSDQKSQNNFLVGATANPPNYDYWKWSTDKGALF